MKSLTMDKQCKSYTSLYKKQNKSLTILWHKFMPIQTKEKESIFNKKLALITYLFISF